MPGSPHLTFMQGMVLCLPVKHWRRIFLKSTRFNWTIRRSAKVTTAGKRVWPWSCIHFWKAKISLMYKTSICALLLRLSQLKVCAVPSIFVCMWDSIEKSCTRKVPNIWTPLMGYQLKIAGKQLVATDYGQTVSNFFILTWANSCWETWKSGKNVLVFFLDQVKIPLLHYQTSRKVQNFDWLRLSIWKGLRQKLKTKFFSVLNP